MNKPFLAALAVLLLAAMVAARLPAQTSSGQAPLGPVHVTFDGGSYVGDALQLRNMVLTSKDYDLRAATAVADISPASGGAGAPSLRKVAAAGDPARNTQVVGRFASVEQARTYLVRGDKAVFVPEPSRPGGGRIDFTGHVVVTLQAPQALDGPAVTRLDHATVLVGPQPAYPQVTFSAGQLDFTPLP